MMRLLLLLLLLGLTLPVRADDCRSSGTNLGWSNPTTWTDCPDDSVPSLPGVPGAGDTALILSGHTVTLDADVTVDAVTVQDSGILRFDATPRAVTVTGDVTVATGGTFEVQLSGAAAHAMTVGGHLYADGTFLMRLAADRYCDVTFNGQGDRTVTGSATFSDLTVDLGDAAHTLDVQGIISMAPGGLTLTRGTLRLSSASTLTPFSGDVTLPIDAGFHLNHSSATVGWDAAGDFTVNGSLTVTAGTLYTAGTTGKTFDLNGSSARLTVEGGVLDIGGRYRQTNSSAATITGGEVRVATAGPAGTASIGTFQVPAGSKLTMSGGRVHLHHGSNSTSPDARSLKLTTAPSNALLTGGTFAVGKGSGTTGTIRLEIDGIGLYALEIDTPGQEPLLESDLLIIKRLTLANGNLKSNGRTVHMLSNAEYPGVAVLIVGNGSIEGNVTYNRYYATHTPGWRMIAAPLQNVLFSSLNDDFHTQGAANADFTNGAPALYRFDAATQTFEAISDYANGFTLGEGYLFYMYAQDAQGNAALPAGWDAHGHLPPGQVVRSLVHQEGCFFNLVGNPFTGPIDWVQLVEQRSTNIGDTYYVWDPGANSGQGVYRCYKRGVGGDAGRYIAPFQSFWVETTGPDPEINFTKNLVVQDTEPSYFGKRRTDDRPPHVRLELSGEGLAATPAYLILHPDAADGWDRYDAGWPAPLGTEHATLTLGDAGSRARLYEGRALTAGRAAFQVDAAATRPGTYTLAWPTLHDLPPDHALTLTDHATGTTVDMRVHGTYTFDFAAAAKTARAARAGKQAAGLSAPRTRSTAAAARFTVAVAAPALPVELTTFTAHADGPAAVLQWQTASETNNAGFTVETRHGASLQGHGASLQGRGASLQENAWQPLGFVAGHGTTQAPQRYTYRTADLAPGVHRFRLRQVDYDGTASYSPEVEVTVDVPRVLALSPAYPNPFHATTRLTFTVPADGRATVQVYDVLGRRVATLFDGPARAGETHPVTFDAQGLAAGLYLYTLTAAGQRTQRMVVLEQ